MSERVYSSSDLASEFDITPRTLRFYEEKGLLALPVRARNACSATLTGCGWA